MAKLSRESYVKRNEALVERHKRKGDKAWAQAKNSGEGWQYDVARKNYDKMKVAQDKASDPEKYGY